MLLLACPTKRIESAYVTHRWQAGDTSLWRPNMLHIIITCLFIAIVAHCHHSSVLLVIRVVVCTSIVCCYKCNIYMYTYICIYGPLCLCCPMLVAGMCIFNVYMSGLDRTKAWRFSLEAVFSGLCLSTTSQIVFFLSSWPWPGAWSHRLPRIWYPP